MATPIKNPLLSASVTGLTFDDFPNKPFLLPAAPPIVHAPPVPVVTPTSLLAREPKSLVTVGSSSLDTENLDEINLNASSEDNQSPEVSDPNANPLLEQSNLGTTNDSILSQAASSFSALPSVASNVFSTFSKRITAISSRETTPSNDQFQQDTNANTFVPQLDIQPNYTQQQPHHQQQSINLNQPPPPTFYPPPQGGNYFASAPQPSVQAEIPPPEPPKFYTPGDVPPLPTGSTVPPTNLGGGGQNNFRFSAKKKLYAPIPGLSDQSQIPAATLDPSSVSAPIAYDTSAYSGYSSNDPYQQASAPSQYPIDQQSKHEERKGGSGLFSKITNFAPTGVFQNITGLVQSAAGSITQTIKPESTQNFNQQTQAPPTGITFDQQSNYFGGAPPPPTNFFVPPQFGGQEQANLLVTAPSTEYSNNSLTQPPVSAVPFYNPPPTSGFTQPNTESVQITPSQTQIPFFNPSNLPPTAQPSRPNRPLSRPPSHPSSSYCPQADVSANDQEALAFFNPIQTTTNTQATGGPPVALFDPTKYIAATSGSVTQTAVPPPPFNQTHLPPTSGSSLPPPAGGQTTYRLQKGTKLYKNPLTPQETAPIQVTPNQIPTPLPTAYQTFTPPNQGVSLITDANPFRTVLNTEPQSVPLFTPSAVEPQQTYEPNQSVALFAAPLEENKPETFAINEPSQSVALFSAPLEENKPETFAINEPNKSVPLFSAPLEETKPTEPTNKELQTEKVTEKPIIEQQVQPELFIEDNSSSFFFKPIESVTEVSSESLIQTQSTDLIRPFSNKEETVPLLEPIEPVIEETTETNPPKNELKQSEDPLEQTLEKLSLAADSSIETKTLALPPPATQPHTINNPYRRGSTSETVKPVAVAQPSLANFFIPGPSTTGSGDLNFFATLTATEPVANHSKSGVNFISTPQQEKEISETGTRFQPSSTETTSQNQTSSFFAAPQTEAISENKPGFFYIPTQEKGFVETGHLCTPRTDTIFEPSSTATTSSFFAVPQIETITEKPSYFYTPTQEKETGHFTTPQTETATTSSFFAAPQIETIPEKPRYFYTPTQEKETGHFTTPQTETATTSSFFAAPQIETIPEKPHYFFTPTQKKGTVETPQTETIFQPSSTETASQNQTSSFFAAPQTETIPENKPGFFPIPTQENETVETGHFTTSQTDILPLEQQLPTTTAFFLPLPADIGAIPSILGNKEDIGNNFIESDLQANVPPPIGFDNFIQQIQATNSPVAIVAENTNVQQETTTKLQEQQQQPEIVNRFANLFNQTPAQPEIPKDPSTFFDSFAGQQQNQIQIPAPLEQQQQQLDATAPTVVANEEQRIQYFFNNPPPKDAGAAGDLNYDLVHSGLAIKNLQQRSLTPVSNLVEPPSSACSEFSELSNSTAGQKSIVADLSITETLEKTTIQEEIKTQDIVSPPPTAPSEENITSADSNIKHYEELPEEILKELRMANLLSADKTATAAASVSYKPAVKHWFYKSTLGAKVIWVPFSHYDSALLETSLVMEGDDKPNIVAVEGGRYDVNISERKKMSVYWESEPIEVRRCSWFYKAVDSKNVPYEEQTADVLESEYKQAAESGVWHKTIILGMGEQVVFHGPTVIVHFQQQQNTDAWGGTTQTATRPRVVKRDLDDFNIEQGESQRVDHLLFMVHGIGSACDLKLRSVEEVVEDFRAIARQLVQSHYKNSTDLGLVGRVEVLPISWHSHLHSAEMTEKLQNITLESIPKLRNFTNDTLLDILFYTSPTFCQKIMNTIVSSMNSMYLKYRERHPEFNGGVSLAGHSLGSIILFDLLCHQNPIKESEEKNLENPDQQFLTSSTTQMDSNQLDSNQIGYTMGPAGTGQPFINYAQLIFQPKKFFALGSPIGMFVTIRGIDKLGLDFRLPTCPGFYNIFHPYDPVAYRMEALVNTDLSGARPVLIPHHKGRKRMHLELKETMTRVSMDLKQRFFDKFKTTIDSVNIFAPATKTKKEAEELMEKEVEKVIQMQMQLEHQDQPQSTSTTTQSHDKLSPGDDVPNPSSTSLRQRTDSVSTVLSDDMVEIDLPLGKLNDSKRIDYVLQEAPLEFFNEYIFALSSHVCYWDSEDTILFVMKEIYTGLGISPDSQVPQQTMTIERPSSRNSLLSTS